MNDQTPNSALVGNGPAGPIPRAFERAYLWTVAAIGGLGTALLIVMAVATQSGTEAERIAGSGGGSYLEALVSALAVSQGRRPL